MKIDLSGKLAVISGASQGLGEGMARAFTDAGARVALVARNAGKLERLCGALPGASAHAADVTQEGDVARIAAAIGPADILVNCAGTNVRKDVTDFPLAEFESVMASSLRGTFLMTRAFAPAMKRKKAGRILSVSSMFGHVSLPQRSAYSSAKAAMLGFTKAVALELAPFAITVNTISPGPVATDINRAIREDPEANRHFTDNIPLGRWGTIEEIAALACFLVSDQAGFITGTDVMIDGGWTAK